MPKSKTYLIDANVWVALNYPLHEHHRSASHWFESIGDTQAILCRVAELTLLRLVTNRQVMGQNVMTIRNAWGMVQELRSDFRVAFRPEPPNLELYWQSLMEDHQAGHQTWVYAYLAAFASGYEATMVTFDKGFQKWPQPEVLLLT
jgi:uncharacterized protein